MECDASSLDVLDAKDLPEGVYIAEDTGKVWIRAKRDDEKLEWIRHEIGEGASTPLISDVPFGFVIPFLLMLGVACYLKGFNRQSNKERKKAQ